MSKMNPNEKDENASKNENVNNEDLPPARSWLKPTSDVSA